jgi:hypothetical protein
MSFDNETLCFAGCGKMGTLRCAGCLVAFYCGKVCQSNSWQKHKGPCKEVVKARAAVEEFEANEKVEATAPATTPALPLRLCAQGCGEIATLRCTRCLGAWYCSKECVKIAWPEHKGPCKLAAEVLDGQAIDKFDRDFEIKLMQRPGMWKRSSSPASTILMARVLLLINARDSSGLSSRLRRDI